MRGKGGQQYIHGLMLLQATYKDTCRLTPVEHYTPKVHMSKSKVTLYTSKVSMQYLFTRCVYHSYNPPITLMKLLSHVLY